MPAIDYNLCVFVLLFITVSSIQVTTGQSRRARNFVFPEDTPENPSPPPLIPLRQPVPLLIPQSMPRPPPTNGSISDVSPCAPYNPPAPDFKAGGKRISQAKCYEYIWELKLRTEKAKRAAECFYINTRKKIPGIVGGHSTQRGQFPNMGAIGWKAFIGSWKFMCGGTLISSKFVLTAAHCSSAVQTDTSIADIVPKIVRLGDKNILDHNDDGVAPHDVYIIRIIVHPNYKSPKQYFDIALMELGREQKFSMDIQPACLWTRHEISISKKAEVSGWGVVESGSLQTSPELLTAEVDIIDQDKCDSLLTKTWNRYFKGLQEHQMCAGKLSGGVDACQGDSGGPLQVKIKLPITSQGAMNFVVGVTSFGVGCGLPGLPGVYTRVSSFVDWIEGIVWPGQ